MKKIILDNDDDSLTLPAVQAAIIDQVNHHPTDILTLYKKVFEADEQTALFIRGRAAELAPEDLAAREEIARLALEVVELKGRQMLVNGLGERLNGHRQPASSKAAAKSA